MRNMNVNVDDMNLTQYVIGNFERFFDLTEGRLLSLNRLMNAYNGHAITMGQFKQVFGLDNFTDILKYVCNMDNFDGLVNYGQMCLADYQAQLENENSVKHKMN